MKSELHIVVKVPGSPASSLGQIPVMTAQKIVDAIDTICRQDLATFKLTSNI